MRGLRSRSGCIFAATTTAPCATPAQRTYANPVDIDYRYNFEQVNERISYRTGADPVIVRHGDAYYLFMTLADGYWRSTDLVDWQFVTPSRWPFDSMVAPAVASDGGRLLLMRAMSAPGPILESTDPAHGRWEFLTRRTPELPNVVPPGWDRDLPSWHNGDPQPKQIPPGPWDPAFFKDDDGRWYLYWGSSDRFPLYGIAMDLHDGVHYIGDARALIALDPKRHGWERFGRDHGDESHAVYIEGAWMTRVGDRYYLQYAAPGTEYNAYATGTYVGNGPLGPFEYAPYNPVGYKPGGFVEGAGHGNTFADAFGNWWNTGSSWIGYNWPFERRIGLYPAAFDADGQMRVSTRFGDFPHYMPTAKVDDPESLFTGWMLLSYRKHAFASSTMASTKSADFSAQNVTDENPRTFWVAARNEPGQTLTVDLGAVKTLRASRSTSPTTHRPATPMLRTSTPNSASSNRSTASAGSRWPRPGRNGATGPTPISHCPRPCARATCVTCTRTSARPRSRSATCGCSAMRAAMRARPRHPRHAR